MDVILMVTTIVACVVAAIRIMVLAAKVKKRAKEIEEWEAAGHVVFHEKIDDLCIASEIKKSLVVVFGIWACPTSLINVWFCSYAGPFSKAVAIVSIIAGFVLTIRALENRQA